MTVHADRIERMTSHIALGRSKDDFTPALSEEESTLWDAIAADVEQMKSDGITVEIAGEWRG
jgi:hypothetical protein